MITFLLALLLWMVGAGPAPAPPVAVHVAPASASVVPPAHRAPRSETHQPPAAAPTVAPAVLDPEHPDYQPQLPDEVIGRQEDGPNGEACVVIDAQLHMSCTPAPAAAP